MLGVATGLFVGIASQPVITHAHQIVDTTRAGSRPHKAAPSERAEVAIAVRDRGESARLHVLVLSSEPFAHRRLVPHPVQRGFAVRLRSWSDGIDPPPLAVTSDADATPTGEPSVDPAAVEPTTAAELLERYRHDDPYAAHTVSAVLLPGDQAVLRGPSCRPDCQARLASGVAVVARGLPAATIDALFSAAKRHRNGPTTVLALAERLREQWPSKLVVRSSAYFVVDADGRVDESIFVDFDPSGRAENALAPLHGWHLGETVVPVAIERATEALARGDKRALRAAVDQAVPAARAAIRTNGGVARWHARLALALALGHRGNDEAVRAIQTAIEMAPNDADLRLIAARVFELRGDADAARREVGIAMRIDPRHHALRDATETAVERAGRP